MVIETTTSENHPVIEPATLAPPPDPARLDMRSILVCCVHCLHYYVSTHSDFIITRNFRLGSKRSPLRSHCTKCSKTWHIHSFNHDHGFAEVVTSRHRQVSDLKDVADSCNMEVAMNGKCSKHEMYRMYRIQTRQEASNLVPPPFKRWTQRGGN